MNYKTLIEIINNPQINILITASTLKEVGKFMTKLYDDVCKNRSKFYAVDFDWFDGFDHKEFHRNGVRLVGYKFNPDYLRGKKYDTIFCVNPSNKGIGEKDCEFLQTLSNNIEWIYQD